MHAAVKLRVRIPKDRRVQLPEDVPVGQAEIIVLYPESASPEATGNERASRKTPRGEKVRGGARRGSSATRGEQVDYFARLIARQPRPLSAEASRALDEANRGDR